jgi:hypothetical protein
LFERLEATTPDDAGTDDSDSLSDTTSATEVRFSIRNHFYN